MKHKHTPGPWHYVKLDDSFTSLQSVDLRGDGDYIANLEIFGEADARLIAAAPGLLAALVAILAEIDLQTIGGDMARAALAKAGQS